MDLPRALASISLAPRSTCGTQMRMLLAMIATPTTSTSDNQLPFTRSCRRRNSCATLHISTPGADMQDMPSHRKFRQKGRCSVVSGHEAALTGLAPGKAWPMSRCCATALVRVELHPVSSLQSFRFCIENRKGHGETEWLEWAGMFAMTSFLWMSRGLDSVAGEGAATIAAMGEKQEPADLKGRGSSG